MRVLAIAVAVCCFVVGVSRAAEVDAAIRKPTNIPAQALEPALHIFAKERAIQVVYRSEVVGDLRTSGAVGELTANEALKLLLQGTGLTFRYLDDRAVTIVPAASVAPAAGAAEDPANPVQRLAQSEPAQMQKAAEPPSPSPAAKDPAGSLKNENSREIQEVVVTAQKRQERLVDTPISIGVLSGEELDHGSSRGVIDVLSQVGGVTITEAAPGEVFISVRGVVPGAGVSTVAYYQDEVPLSFVSESQLPDSNAFDLARVEVLRGPQGTLYGANALSGVVRVLTNDANLDAFQIKGRTRASSTEGGSGNYGGDLAVNVPLIPGELAIRAVASYSELSGFVDSSFDGQNRINDTRAQNYRLKMNWRPNEALSVKLGYSRSEIDNGAPARAFDDFTTPFSSNQIDDRVLDIYHLIAEYQWRGISLISATGYSEYTTQKRDEILLSGTARLNFNNEKGARAFNQELRFSSRIGESWLWSAGAFYKDTTQIIAQDARPTFPAVGLTDFNSETYAVFADTTRSFGGGRFEITGGLRYFNDRLFSVQPSSLTRTGGWPDQLSEFSRTTGRLVFAYKPVQGSMFYGAVSTGFRSGLNQTASIKEQAPGIPNLGPDNLTTYEVGAKGLLLDGVLSYETAVYYTDWEDIQQSLILPIGFAAVVNAGNASGVGVDTTLSYRATTALTLDASIGWNDLSLEDNIFSQGVALFLKDARPNNSPTWTGSVGANYRRATPKPGLNLVLSGNFAYGSERSARYLTAGVVRETLSDDMRLLKATVGLESDRWSLGIYGDNLLNDDKAIAPYDLTFGSTAVRQRPRTIGLQVTFDY